MTLDTATVAKESQVPAIANYAKLAHVGICGPNPAELAAFYREMFGMELTDTIALTAPPVGAVFASSRPAEEHHEIAIFDDAKFRHVAFKVERAADLAAYYQVVKAKGLPIVFLADHAVSVAMMFVDPAGNLVEVYLPTGPSELGGVAFIPLDEAQLVARLAELA